MNNNSSTFRLVDHKCVLEKTCIEAAVVFLVTGVIKLLSIFRVKKTICSLNFALFQLLQFCHTIILTRNFLAPSLNSKNCTTLFFHYVTNNYIIEN